jgi:hypothetical protein
MCIIGCRSTSKMPIVAGLGGRGGLTRGILATQEAEDQEDHGWKPAAGK